MSENEVKKDLTFNVYNTSKELFNYDSREDLKNLVVDSYKMAGITNIGKYSVEKYNEMIQKVPFGEREYQKDYFVEEFTIFNKLRQYILQFDSIVNSLIEKKLQDSLLENELKFKIAKMENLKKKLKCENHNNFDIEGEVEVVLKSDDSPLSEYERQSYFLKIEKINIEIHKKVVEKTRSAKLIQDSVKTKEVLEKNIDKCMELINILEENGITEDMESPIYYGRWFETDFKLKQFVANGFHVERIIKSVDGSETKQMVDVTRGVDSARLLSILRMDERSRKITLRNVGLPENLKEMLGIDYENQDTKENIVENYKRYL